MKNTGLNYNERSWAIDLISYLNSLVAVDDSIKRFGGEYSLISSGQALFPDVLLFGDSGTGNILQGWELKMPDTSIDDVEFIENATEKAKRLGLNSFLLWNAVAVKLYIFSDNKYSPDQNFNIPLSHYIARRDVHDRPDIWQKTARIILRLLNVYFKTGKLQTVTPQVLFSDKGIIPIVLSCQADVKKYLEDLSRNNIRIDASIKAWWRCVHNEYPGYDTPEAPLAYVIILKWFNRFVFSNILYAYGKISNKKPLLNENSTINDAIQLFNKISSQNDYWNIIGPSEFDDLLPKKAWERLVSIFNLLQEYDFSKIDKSILTEIIQATVLLSIKRAAGLFSTPPKVAELLVKLSLWDKDAPSIDPFCGTGTIVKKILETKSDYNIDGKSVIKNTWACDKFGFPVQVANLAVATPEVIAEAMQIFTHDAFDLFTGENIDFINPKNGEKESKELPKFGSIISNLPFVSFEDISILNPKVLSKIDEFYIKNNISDGEELDGRSDLYCYIPFLLLPLIKEEGIFGIIISNSWLSTKAGEKFRRLLKKFYKIECILTSSRGRWFSNTDVVTNMIILKKKKIDYIKDEYITIFASIKTDINKTNDIDDIVIDIYSKNTNSSLVEIQTYTDDQLEKIEKLKLGFNACFGNCEWLVNNIDKFTSISKYASIARGERRGWDKLFYPGKSEAEKIEKEYIKPVYKTTKGSVYYNVVADSPAFCCEKSIDELKTLGHQGALQWIKKFENGTNTDGKPLVAVLSKPNLIWYEMSSSTLATFALSINPDKKIGFYRFKTPSFVNQRVISISPKEDIDIELMHAILNSIIVTSQIESLGFGRGLGVLDINATIIKNGLYIPKLESINSIDRNRIVKAFSEICKYEIMDTIDTIADKKWESFNLLVLESIQLPSKVLESIYSHFKRVYSIRKAVENE
ncbi:hypothetical protein SDC9_05140 [bioreactor metagenome]|uniref:DNA methylase adenine-specific domain-containing protein n=1 Tax=bioreactor metagenome TaxID=1076179 RepID=A0A644SY31_9ZZZZ